MGVYTYLSNFRKEYDDEPEVQTQLRNGVVVAEAEERDVGVHHSQADVADKEAGVAGDGTTVEHKDLLQGGEGPAVTTKGRLHA